LSLIEYLLQFKGAKPSKNFLIAQNTYSENIHLFLNRYYTDTLDKISNLKTDKAKYRRVEDFHNNMEKYLHKMSEENIEEYKSMYNCLYQNNYKDTAVKIK